MSDLWAVHGDHSHVIHHHAALVLGHALDGDPLLPVVALRAGAVEQDVPGYGRALFGIEWNLDLVVERYDGVRQRAVARGFVGLDAAVEAVQRDMGGLARARRDTFDRLVADYIDPNGGGDLVDAAVIGAAFATILPAMERSQSTPEFTRALELMARERFTESAALLREPIEEILNWIRPGHLWGNADRGAANSAAQRVGDTMQPRQSPGPSRGEIPAGARRSR